MEVKNVQALIHEAAEKLQEADAIIVGGGSGLSSAAGYNHYHNNEMYRKHFQDFDDQYGIKNLMKGFYYVYSKLEQKWGFYTRYLHFMHQAPVGQPYLDLQHILQGNNYHILTTNVDGQFSHVFPEEKICYYQGDFRYFQCEQPCHDHIYRNEELVEQMLSQMEGLELPYEFIPRCPECGWKMVPWVQDDTFLRGNAWRESFQRYERFVRDNYEKKIVLLQLGVGEMTPSIIKLPFWEMTASYPDAYLINVNLEKTTPPEHLKGKITTIPMDIGTFLQKVREEMK